MFHDLGLDDEDDGGRGSRFDAGSEPSDSDPGSDSESDSDQSTDSESETETEPTPVRPRTFHEMTFSPSDADPNGSSPVVVPPAGDSPEPSESSEGAESIQPKLDILHRMSPAQMAFALLFEKSGGSREEYARLREVWNFAVEIGMNEASIAQNHSDVGSTGNAQQEATSDVSSVNEYDDNVVYGDVMLEDVETRLDNAAEMDAASSVDYERPNLVATAHLKHSLPIKLDTLKRRLRRQLPMLKLMRKPIPVIIAKQPSMPTKDKELGIIRKKTYCYWYEPKGLVSGILSAGRLRQFMYQGMAMYVDRPSELYHSRAWGSSIRAASGDNAHSQEGVLLIAGDIVRFNDTICTSSNRSYTKGRIIFIGRDFRTARPYAPDTDHPVVITLQVVTSTTAMETLNQSPEASDPYNEELMRKLPQPSEYGGQSELLLLEDEIVEVLETDIQHHLPVHLDRDFSGKGRETYFDDDRFYIRRVLRIDKSTVRPAKKLHPTRGELEIDEYGREHLVEMFDSGVPVISFPYQLFIDGFAVHRNNYRSLTAFYIVCTPSTLGMLRTES